MASLFAGIDYGSKKAGTTVIAFSEGGRVQFLQSEKNRDADQFIEQWCMTNQPEQLFLDAPMSLPGVYRQLPGCGDYFYRKADRLAGGMSPMFLGALTARAIRLKARLEEKQIDMREVYPGKLAKILELDKNQYKQSKRFLLPILQQITSHTTWQIEQKTVISWHHIDALLALLSGWRYRQGEHRTFGEEEEGQIIV